MSWEPPSTLSPSKMSTFLTCPMQFRFNYIQKSPSIPGEAAVRGTTVHRALETFFGFEPERRTAFTLEGEANLALDETFASTDYKALALSKVQEAKFERDVHKLASKYLNMEDPAQVRVAGLELHLKVPWEGIVLSGIIDRLDHGVTGPKVVDYKGLDVDTAIPTPTGWTTMGEVQVGDRVMGGDGYPCTVTGKSESKLIPCYRILFDDGSEIVCDEEHLWEFEVSSGADKWEPDLRSAADWFDRGVMDLRQRQRGLRVRTVASHLPEVPLPVDPYVFGAWIGDGHRGRGEISKPLPALFDEIRRRGYAVGEPHGNGDREPMTRTVFGLQSKLCRMGQLGSKRIPDTYMRSSWLQRLDLLRGIMDTDGHWNETRNRAVLNTTNHLFASQVQELVISLGWTSTMFPTKATGFGKEWDAWQVWFSPTGCDVFLVRNQGSRSRSARSRRRLVKSIERVPSTPTQCIEVDSLDHCYLAGRQMVRTHNTGRTPGEKWQQKSMAGIYFYGVMVFEEFGELAESVHLYYVESGTDISAELTERSVKATKQKIKAVWGAIERACERDDFRPQVNNLCDNWCSYKPYCPAHGGNPEEVPLPDPQMKIDEDLT